MKQMSDMTWDEVRIAVTQMQDRDDRICYLEGLLEQMEDRGETKTELYRNVRCLYKSL